MTKSGPPNCPRLARRHVVSWLGGPLLSTQADAHTRPHIQGRWLIYVLSNQTLTHNEHTAQPNVKAILYVVCQHECVCVPFSLWWMCNEVAKASIQQFSIYELLTLERRDLNITPSWNNSTSLSPSSALLSLRLPPQSFTRKADGLTSESNWRGTHPKCI